MGEFFTPHDQGELHGETPELRRNKKTVALAFGQLKADYGSAEFLDEEAVSKINAAHTELDKLMAEAGISWDTELQSNQFSAVKNKVMGPYASDDPQEIARDLMKYFKTGF